MGQIASVVTSELDTSQEKEAQAKEQLELMMKLADARLDTFEANLKTMFLDRESAMRTSVPGRRALRFERNYRVDTDNGADEEIGNAVDAYFGAADAGSKGFLEGFKSIVKAALSAILGDSSAGECYGQKVFVGTKHNTIVRIDMYTYKYNFSNKGVVSNHKNFLAYILCTSIVDHRDTTVDELMYLASECADDGDMGPDSGYEMYLSSLKKTWNSLKGMDSMPIPGRPQINRPLMPFN